jgi:hypothetical protein
VNGWIQAAAPGDSCDRDLGDHGLALAKKLRFEGRVVRLPRGVRNLKVASTGSDRAVTKECPANDIPSETAHALSRCNSITALQVSRRHPSARREDLVIPR